MNKKTGLIIAGIAVALIGFAIYASNRKKRVKQLQANISNMVNKK